MKIYRQNKNSDIAENPFWIAYSDLLSSLALVFLIFIFAFLGLNTLLMKKQEKQINEQKMVIIEKSKLVDEKSKLVEEKSKLVEAKTKLEKKVQMLRINENAQTLSKLKEKLEELQKKYPNQIVIDKKSGVVKIQNKILFDTGSATLRAEGKAFLQRFMKDWSKDFLSPELIGKGGLIEYIVFEGHADPVGSSNFGENYKQNMTLSLARAEEVTKFIFSDACQFNRKEELRKKVTASGRSNIESFQTGKKLTAEEMQKFRCVQLKLLFRNPLLEWDSYN